MNLVEICIVDKRSHGRWGNVQFHSLVLARHTFDTNLFFGPNLDFRPSVRKQTIGPDPRERARLTASTMEASTTRHVQM